MTVDPSHAAETQAPVPKIEPFRVKFPFGVSVPCAESKTGILKNYTSYCIKVNDFGRQVEFQHRFDDFVKLHESLSTFAGISLPPLPAKQMFGGNDPKVVEERRPMLEKLLKECVQNEKALGDSHDALYKFFDISSPGVIVSKFLCPATREEYLPKLVDLLKPETVSENYRLFNDSVLRVLLHLIQKSPSTDTKTITTALDVLQFILFHAHRNPLASVDIQQIFVALGGIGIVWSVLVSNPPVREACRRVLSSLISSNSECIEKFESIFFTFLKDHNGLPLLFDSASDDQVHEIIAKLVWFGLSEETQKYISQHKNGLSLLGKLFSSPDPNARSLAGLSLCVLITAGVLDDAKASRAVEGVNSILVSLVASASSPKPPATFFSALCRGSSTGLARILLSLTNGASPMSDFCAYVIVHANLPVEFIEKNSIQEIMENAVLSHPADSVVAMEASVFLFRWFFSSSHLPLARSDGKLPVVLAKIREGIMQYNRTSRSLADGEHKQFAEFQKETVNVQAAGIERKSVGMIDFSGFEELVKGYTKNQAELVEKVKVNQEAISQLGRGVGGGVDGGGWASVGADVAKDWNRSQLGMAEVYGRVAGLKAALEETEEVARSAESDANNLQQVISKMREEIMAVDSKAEEFRKESSRFAAAANGAVDAQLMLQRASENEAKAKEEIAKREALRQSQDSLESQLEAVRAKLVAAQSEASETRRLIAEASAAVQQGEQQHAELEARFKAEIGKSFAQWNQQMEVTQNQLSQVNNVMTNFNEISAMVGRENEQTDLLIAVTGELISKLQSLQQTLQ